MIISQNPSYSHDGYLKFVILISFKCSKLLIKFYDSHTIWFLKEFFLFFSSFKRRLLFIVNVLRFRLKRRFFVCWNNWNSWKSIFCKSNSPSFNPKKACWSNIANERCLLSESFHMSSKRTLFVIKGAFWLVSHPITLPNIQTNQFY